MNRRALAVAMTVAVSVGAVAASLVSHADPAPTLPTDAVTSATFAPISFGVEADCDTGQLEAFTSGFPDDATFDLQIGDHDPESGGLNTATDLSDSFLLGDTYDLHYYSPTFGSGESNGEIGCSDGTPTSST